jgi:anti-sigma regulatory factor (Ser/Thr protein kinase)
MQLKLPVEDASHVAEARRHCIRLAERAGFSEADAGRVAIVATELATNLLKHASKGVLIGGLIEAGSGYAVQILSLDKGSGIPDLAAASRDGFSTAGSPGNGLGALRRLSDIFEVSTAPGEGTAMLAVLYASRSQGRRDRPNWGAVSIAKHGEEVCGDAWAEVSEGSRTAVLVADGLGHGYAAHEAAQEAVRIFREQAGAPVAAIVAAINAGLKKTRGAAVSIARLDYERGVATYAGIGNIAGAIFAEDSIRRMVSLNGTAGIAVRHIQAFDYPLPKGSRVALVSDGIASGWSILKYPGLLRASPALAAGVIFRDFERGRDDATVFVAAGEGA